MFSRNQKSLFSTTTFHFPLALAAALSLTGCPSGVINSQTSAAPPAAPAPPTPLPAPAGPPYTLSATCSAQVINFVITNSGETDLPVDAATDFCIVPRNTRDQVHFSTDNGDMIELLGSPVIPPGGTLRGRAVHTKFSAPGGNKLIFNPGGRSDARDTAVFSAIRSVTPAEAAASATRSR